MSLELTLHTLLPQDLRTAWPLPQPGIRFLQICFSRLPPSGLCLIFEFCFSRLTSNVSNVTIMLILGTLFKTSHLLAPSPVTSNNVFILLGGFFFFFPIQHLLYARFLV